MAINTTYNLVSLEELKTFLAGEEYEYPENMDMNASLEMTINGVSRWMHEYTGRQLKSAELTEYYNGDGTQHLYLHSWPVTASDIRVDNDYGFAADTEITPEIIDDYMAYYSGGFAKGVKNIKVVYTAGYETIPDDLKMACLQQCQVVDREQKKGTSGVGQVTIAGTAVQFQIEALASPMVLNILGRYQRVFQ